jgi:flagellar biosynthesis protein FliR
MSTNYLFTWILVFLRSLGIVILLPQMAGRSPPAIVRTGLGMILATLVVGVIPLATLPLTTSSLLFTAGAEVLLGLAFGYISRMLFSAVDLAARISSSEVGLSGSPGLNTPDMASEPLSSFISSFAFILFFLFGGHLMVISALVRSFEIAPAGHAQFSAGSVTLIINETARVVELGARMGAPFIALNFLVNLAFAALGRAVPRLSVFVLSMPIRGLVGFTLLGGAGGLLARYMYAEVTKLPYDILQLVARHN